MFSTETQLKLELTSFAGHAKLPEMVIKRCQKNEYKN